MSERTSEQNVQFPSNGREAYGYLELPDGGTGPGVIVIQEWWGLTTHIADIVRRLAGEGFVALAPDLYGGRTTHDAKEAMGLARGLPVEQASEDLAGAVDYLLGHEAVTSQSAGVIGFCMGGGFVLSLAAQAAEKVSAAVSFYGLPQRQPDYSSLKAAVQLQLGDADPSIGADAVTSTVTAIADQAGIEAQVHRYPAGHAFLNDENLIGTYDAEQAAVAWERAITFLREHLGAQPRATAPAEPPRGEDG
jgi:carboxymethylenebutenolidase